MVKEQKLEQKTESQKPKAFKALGKGDGSTILLLQNDIVVPGKKYSNKPKCQCGGKIKLGSCGLLDQGRWEIEEDLASLQHEATDQHQAWVRLFLRKTKRLPDRHARREAVEAKRKKEKDEATEKLMKKRSKMITCGCGTLIHKGPAALKSHSVTKNHQTWEKQQTVFSPSPSSSSSLFAT